MKRAPAGLPTGSTVRKRKAAKTTEQRVLERCEGPYIVSLSICLFVCLFAALSLNVCLSLFVFLYLSLSLPIFLSVSLFPCFLLLPRLQQMTFFTIVALVTLAFHLFLSSDLCASRGLPENAQSESINRSIPSSHNTTLLFAFSVLQSATTEKSSRAWIMDDPKEAASAVSAAVPSASSAAGNKSSKPTSTKAAKGGLKHQRVAQEQAESVAAAAAPSGMYVGQLSPCLCGTARGLFVREMESVCV